MTKHEWKVGEVTLTVEAPDNMNVRGVMASVKPRDRAGFLAAADQLGGLEALHMPAHEQGYQASAPAYAQREDGTTISEVAVLLYEPPRAHESAGRPPHPFFGPLAERRDREHPSAGEPGDGDTEEER